MSIAYWEKLSFNAWEEKLIGTLPEIYRYCRGVSFPLLAKNQSEEPALLILKTSEHGTVYFQNASGKTITTNPIVGFAKYSTLKADTATTTKEN
ncbi:MAG: hypothetical protein HFJ52_05800 [Clostridia bacterium]|nr:hypothetical protein [Clostridia bacterium]